MKTEDDARALLREAARKYETPSAPTAELLEIGRRAKARRLVWWAGSATAAVLVVAAIGGLILRAGDDPRTIPPVDTSESTTATQPTGSIAPLVHVPAIAGLSQGLAVQELDGAGLTAIVIDVPSECPNANRVVVGQDPTPGQRVRSGANVYVSIGVVVCGVSADDRRVVERFEAFAADPTAGGPFAQSVALGLGNEFQTSLTGRELVQPDQWRLDLSGYAEGSGMLSVLDLVTANADIRTLTTDLRPSFCPTTLRDRPPPELTRGGHAVRMQILRAPGACLDLATVDLYIDNAGQVVGVNVSLGAP